MNWIKRLLRMKEPHTDETFIMYASRPPSDLDEGKKGVKWKAGSDVYVCKGCKYIWEKL